ncbi:hypothetical protein F0562_013391 [Nyssa sinensis]|uniref:Uncharacterized protein n=1 Tax=Nyssa sinensis TaxID=561372 RepID=A0A5J4ZN78_9ASTE|nr:hypothetical protein F0562_013391 [Nyssa sinensis]
MFARSVDNSKTDMAMLQSILHEISQRQWSITMKVLCSSFDKDMYNHILNFLGIEYVDDEWYVKCIQSSNFVLGVSEDVYLELLLFLADKWWSHFKKTNFRNVLLLKYVGLDGDVSLCTINEVLQRNAKRLLLSFLLNDSLNSGRKLVITHAHCLYHWLSQKYLSGREVDQLCGFMPLVDNYGCVTKKRKGVLVPANGSKWVGLIGSNSWRDEGYVELGEDYLTAGNFAGVSTPAKQLIMFLRSHLEASDVPDLSPPNAVIPTMSAPLTKQNTFLLLDWIRNLKQKRSHMPGNFLNCIKEGRWLKISLNGSPGYRPPSQSFLPSSSWGHLLQNGSVLVDIPLIDQRFYGDEIIEYKEEPKTIGLMSEYGKGCQFIGKRLMSQAASSTLTRGNVLSIPNFIKFLREKLLSPEDFIHSIREGRWLWISHGYRSPVGSVLFDRE